MNKYIYFNPTNSEIRGYYFVYKPQTFEINDLVLVCVRDTRSVNVLHQFGLPYTANGVCQLPFLLKKIVAKNGDIVEISDRGVIINNRLQPNTLAIKHYKNIWLNPLPVGGKYKLDRNEYFLLGRGNNSYDSRYFGIITAVDLQYKAVLFLTSLVF
ncbi:MAG TPA: S26 family signal peptidase [Aquella sp.]|nr:S26 family signal peptidase [Aquella sp.]